MILFFVDHSRTVSFFIQKPEAIRNFFFEHTIKYIFCGPKEPTKNNPCNKRMILFFMCIAVQARLDLRVRERMAKQVLDPVTSVAQATTSVAEASISLLEVLNQESLSNCVHLRSKKRIVLSICSRTTPRLDNERTIALRTVTLNQLFEFPPPCVPSVGASRTPSP